MTSSLPFDLIVHADWSSHPRKRWMCMASRDESVAYHVSSPERVGDLDTFWERLNDRASGGRILVGFDFPIGLPAAYARRAGIDDFKDALLQFGEGPWSEFYERAPHRDDISVHRPFYPRRPGGSKQAHLVDGLGVDDMTSLLRRCERPTGTRGAASSLFWTLGGKQVGPAAIEGWRSFLAPALRSEEHAVAIWPFDGPLSELRDAAKRVVVETYPAEACVHLGMEPPGRTWSKTSQEGRASQASALIAWCRRRGVSVADELRSLVADGFGESKRAEDPFDAVVGLFGMIEVALGHRPAGAPEDPSVQNVEGWILGQSAS